MANEKEGGLQHQRQRLHNGVEIPGDNVVKFSLSAPAPFECRPTLEP